MVSWRVDVIVCERNCSKEERVSVVYCWRMSDISADLPLCGTGDTVFPFARYEIPWAIRSSQSYPKVMDFKHSVPTLPIMAFYFVGFGRMKRSTGNCSGTKD